MKKLIIFSILLTVFFGSKGSFAQKPTERRPAQSGSSVQSAAREVRSGEKREELSKKLLQRKNELRREEHERLRERHNLEDREKSAEIKKN
jgi:hypothetical protein